MIIERKKSSKRNEIHRKLKKERDNQDRDKLYREIREKET